MSGIDSTDFIVADGAAFSMAEDPEGNVFPLLQLVGHLIERPDMPIMYSIMFSAEDLKTLVATISANLP